MSLEVLQNRHQIAAARAEMDRRGISAMTGPLEARVKRAVAMTRLAQPLVMGDFVKSWDVLETVRFLEGRLAPEDPILDIGAYASEVLISLHNAGFRNLTGVDLNPNLAKMPHAGAIRYVESDFMATPFDDGAFAAVTSISVIEHGFDPERLLREAARILRPGGFFTASFDYWPDKVDTGNTRFFGMSWLIFSADDVRAMVDEAGRHGLHPVGPLRFEGGERAVEHGGYDYTFAWLALEKRG